MEARLAMHFSTALMTVMNFRLQLLELVCHFSANAYPNVLISLGSGKAAIVRSTPKSADYTRTYLFIFN